MTVGKWAISSPCVLPACAPDLSTHHLIILKEEGLVPLDHGHEKLPIPYVGPGSI